ncbi:hypothetical protein IG631_22636 [Alternaria alternata]|jgi:hypothetical protein|nr:hypothetical protein IG631_22636 [Alternaria alternata]
MAEMRLSLPRPLHTKGLQPQAAKCMQGPNSSWNTTNRPCVVIGKVACPPLAPRHDCSRIPVRNCG